MKFFPSNIRINERKTDHPADPPKPGQNPEEPSDAKEVLLLSSGLLALVLGIGGILMYTEDEPMPATASQPVAGMELAKAFSPPVTQSDLSGSPIPEVPSLAEESEMALAVPVPASSGQVPMATSEPIVVQFPFAQSTLTEEAKAVLNTQVSHLPEAWEGTLRIQGHTDMRGSDSYNRSLGTQRAQSVKSYLVSLGISEDRIQTDSFGKDAPLCQEDTPACHEQNRRAQVEWITTPVAQDSPDQADEPMVSMNTPLSADGITGETGQPATVDPASSDADDAASAAPIEQDSPVLEESSPELVTADPIANADAHP